MPCIPNRPPNMDADSERDLRFDGFSAPPAGAEQKVPTLCLTHKLIIQQLAPRPVLAGVLGNSITNQEYKENKKKWENMR